MKKYLFIVLLVGVGYGQLDSGNVNIEQLLRNELKKDIKHPSRATIVDSFLVTIFDVNDPPDPEARYTHAWYVATLTGIGKIIKISCCGGCVFGLLGFSIMPEIGFWGILLGSIYPNIALIKARERLGKGEPVYPKSIVSDEEKKQYLKIYEEEKKKISGRDINKSCIIGAIGFLTVMHILMNTDVYFGWFPTAG